MLNELAREELSWKSPFEVYWLNTNQLECSNNQNAGIYMPKQVIVDKRIIELPSTKNLQERVKRI